MRWMLIALVVGCGGSEKAEDLNPAMQGNFVGTTVLTLSGSQPISYPGALAVIVVTGNLGTITQICPDGTGYMNVTGSLDTILWSGRYQCAPVPFGGCSAVTFTFASANLHFTPPNSLAAQGSATASGCGQSIPAAFSFVGTK